MSIYDLNIVTIGVFIANSNTYNNITGSLLEWHVTFMNVTNHVTNDTMISLCYVVCDMYKRNGRLR